MTVDKKEVITIPKWLVIWVIPMIISLIVAYGTISTWKGSYETKAIRNEQEIIRLQDQKVDRNEIANLREQLNRIESKLDQHIENK